MRFRRGKRFQKLRELVRPPFAKRMRRLRPQHKLHWWALAGAAAVLCGIVGWTIV